MGCLFSLESLGWRGRGRERHGPTRSWRAHSRVWAHVGSFLQGGSKWPTPTPGAWVCGCLLLFQFSASSLHSRKSLLSWTGLTTRGGRGNLGACTYTPDGTGLPSGDGLVQISLSNPFSPGNGVWWGKCFIPVTKHFPEDGVVRLIRAEGGS